MKLGPQVSPEEIKSREVELGCESWTSFASSCSSTAVQQTSSLWLCPSTAVETAIAQCTSRWAMARGHRLNTSIVLAAVHGLSGLFRVVSAVEPFTLSSPPPPPPPSLSLISHLASVDVKQNVLVPRSASDCPLYVSPTPEDIKQSATPHVGERYRLLCVCRECTISRCHCDAGTSWD